MHGRNWNGFNHGVPIANLERAQPASERAEFFRINFPPRAGKGQQPGGTRGGRSRFFCLLQTPLEKFTKSNVWFHEEETEGGLADAAERRFLTSWIPCRIQPLMVCSVRPWRCPISAHDSPRRKRATRAPRTAGANCSNAWST